MDFGERLNRVNGRLKAAKISVKVAQVGSWLYLRGTLPPPPGSAKDRPYQQRVALGLPANSRGLSVAESRAKEAGTALELRTFDWADYRSDRAETVGEWVKRFHQQFEGAALTWSTDYQQPFNKLPSNAPLTAELLTQTLESVKAKLPNSRAQLRAYNAFRQLAAYANVSTDELKGLKGNYSASEVDPRNLPTDQEIATMRDDIKDAGWRWLFGILAAYGLRGHEAYKVDLADFPTVRVPPDTKTGSRFVWPLYPEWAERWELKDRTFPPLAKIPSYTNGQLGTKTAKFFERMPCDAYDLRHCYARRCFEFGYSPEFGAKMMGHSPEVHCRTYRRWIDEGVYWRVYQKGVNGRDRPSCP
ncbi:MAG: integrase [Cyanobacteria bacterium P01_C01_bin.120]